MCVGQCARSVRANNEVLIKAKSTQRAEVTEASFQSRSIELYGQMSGTVGGYTVAILSRCATREQNSPSTCSG